MKQESSFSHQTDTWKPDQSRGLEFNTTDACTCVRVSVLSERRRRAEAELSLLVARVLR